MTAVAIDADSACRNILGEWRGRIPGNVLVMEAHPAIGDFYLQEFDLSRPSYCRVMENVPFSGKGGPHASRMVPTPAANRALLMVERESRLGMVSLRVLISFHHAECV